MPDQGYAATEHALLEEITRPLEQLPADPIQRVRAEFPTAMRGYDRDAVDEYVRETSRLVAELQAVRTPETAVRRALVRAGGMISQILRRAHETAGEITAQSRSEAEDRLQLARGEAEELVQRATRRVREFDADTDRIWSDRQRIVADVEELAEQLLELARQAGDRFDAEPDSAPTGPQPAAGPDAPSAGESPDDDLEPPTGLFDIDNPPEVEPRSARLTHRPDEADAAAPGPAAAIPPMSDAAGRHRQP